MRNPGTHMGVSRDGSFVGSLSGGCIENAVVAEAQSALEKGSSRLVRFGAGSPYLDIRLPCGGGLDVHFQPLRDDTLVRSASQAIAARKPFSVELDRANVVFREGWRETSFDRENGQGTFGHWPQARLLIVGHGAGVEALAQLGGTMGCEVVVHTPDERVAGRLSKSAAHVSHLARTTDIGQLESDPWTAIVFLFHDHDWETSLMTHALTLPHFYIGAMGGRQAHAARKVALMQSGVSERAFDTIHAPVGLFHSSRDPMTLALSTLGQIVHAYHETDFGALNG